MARWRRRRLELVRLISFAIEVNLSFAEVPMRAADRTDGNHQHRRGDEDRTAVIRPPAGPP
jgi:hypothetical protein